MKTKEFEISIEEFKKLREAKKICVVKEASKITGASPSRIYGWKDEGKIKSLKFGGKVYIYIDSLNALIKNE